MLTSRSDAYISRSGDFRGDDRRQTDKTDCFTPCAHARGVKKKALAMGVAIIIIMHLRKITKLSLVGRQEAILNFNSKRYVICSI